MLTIATRHLEFLYTRSLGSSVDMDAKRIDEEHDLRGKAVMCRVSASMSCRSLLAPARGISRMRGCRDFPADQSYVRYRDDDGSQEMPMALTRSNVAVGASAEKSALTRKKRRSARCSVSSWRRGPSFGSIDVTGGQWLTKINVTSPTGIVAIKRFDGTDVAEMIWDAIEARFAI